MPVTRSFRWLPSVAILIASTLASSFAAAETLSADEAIRLASQKNPNLRAALLDVQAARQALDAEENARTPTFVASATGQYAENIGATDRTDSESIMGKAGVSYTTDIGTKLEVGVQSDVVWRNLNGTSPTLGAEGPTYGTSAYFTARQPLLRGAGTDSVLAPIVQADASRLAAERESELVASQTALDVLGAYWELWYADRAVLVQERALEVAMKQYKDAKTRADNLGTATKVDVLQFASSVANIQDSLSQARTSRVTKAIALGRVIGVGADDAMALTTEDELPSLGNAPAAASLRETLVARSKELASLRAQIDSGTSRLASARDADQPRLDVFTTVSVGAQWTSGDDYSGASMPGGRPAFGVMGGLEFEVPLGESRASSVAAQAATQLEATRERYRARVDAIDAEIASLGVQLSSAKTQVELAGTSVEIARDLAAAERARLALGTATSSDVVRAEQTLREAELRHLRATVNQVTMQFTLEHDAGALLDRFGSMNARRPS